MQKYEKLEELIQDDDKVVTVASFAKETNLSLQEAKNVILEYAANHKQISVTYVLTGIKKSDHSYSIIIVKNGDLEAEREQFEDGVSETVFSVQKTQSIDYNFISLADPFCAKRNDDPALGSIVSKNCHKRVLRKKTTPANSQTQKFVKLEENSKTEKDAVTTNRSKNGIANMFNKMAQNKSEEVKPKTQKPNNRKNGGIASFLSKTSSKESVTSKPEKEAKLSFEKEDIESVEEDMLMNVDIQPSKSEIVKTEKKQDKAKSSKKRKAASDNKSAKKRKRIVVADDSESDDDIFEPEKEDEEMVKSDEEPEAINKPLPPKNKRRKAVDKTYEDEEGFIVTKTEYVYESASEDEVTTEPPKKVEEKPKLKSSSNSENELPNYQKGAKGKKGSKKGPAVNQPTLMNFFAKK